MVGGLVEDEHLVLTDEQRGQGHPFGLATRQLVGCSIEQFTHAQALQHRFGLPGAAGRLANGGAAEHWLLREHPNTHTTAPAHFATGLRLLLTGEHAQQGRLAAAVDAHHADAVAGGHRDRDVGEQGAVGP